MALGRSASPSSKIRTAAAHHFVCTRSSVISAGMGPLKLGPLYLLMCLENSPNRAQVISHEAGESAA
jgi:hypothetical protein